jgi:glutamate racemase
MKANNPIGIFDSGIGGLTVVKELVRQLPNEDIIYFGDKAYFPYGDKSKKFLEERALKITDFLLAQNCKMILIACGTASAATYEVVKQRAENSALTANVIDPTISYLSENFARKHIGLLATKQTVNSKVYDDKIDELNLGITLSAVAAPVLTVAIEEGFLNTIVITELLRAYLSRPEIQGIQALILGCTHYPLVQKEISEFYNGSIPVINPAAIVVEQLKEQLSGHDLLNLNADSRRRFYVSDDPADLNNNTELFFSEPIKLEYYKL